MHIVAKSSSNCLGNTPLSEQTTKFEKKIIIYYMTEQEAKWVSKLQGSETKNWYKKTINDLVTEYLFSQNVLKMSNIYGKNSCIWHTTSTTHFHASTGMLPFKALYSYDTPYSFSHWTQKFQSSDVFGES